MGALADGTLIPRRTCTRVLSSFEVLSSSWKAVNQLSTKLRKRESDSRPKAG